MKPHHADPEGGEQKEADDPAHAGKHGTRSGGLKPELRTKKDPLVPERVRMNFQISFCAQLPAEAKAETDA
jgi:hypothetical protein